MMYDRAVGKAITAVSQRKESRPVTIKGPVPPPERSSFGEAKLPDPKPRYTYALAEGWASEHLDEMADAAIPELPYRMSMAANRCDRQAVYHMRRTPQTNPITIADLWRFSIGTAVHDRFDQIIPQIFPNAVAKSVVDLRNIGVEGSARPDMLIYADDTETVLDVIEVKTAGGFKFKKKATNFKGVAEGPDYAHIVQAAVPALSLDAQRDVVIVYFALENLSPSLAQKYTDSEIGRFSAEWRYPRDVWEPIARAEVARIQRLMAWLDLKGTPTREIHDWAVPDGAIFTDPARITWQQFDMNGNVVQIGTHWSCDYCSYRDVCIADGVGGLVDDDYLEEPMF